MIAGIAGAFAAAFALQWFRREPTMSKAKIDSAFSSSRFGALLQSDFANDYDDLVAKLQEAANKPGATQAEISDYATTLTGSIRKKYAKYADRAGDIRLRNAIETQALMLEAVERKRGTLQCAEVANSGIMALGQVADLTPEIESAAVATMEAISDGRRFPVHRASATDADVGLLWAAFDDAKDQAKAALSDKRTTPEDCAASITSLRTALALKGDSGERIRASIVDRLAAN